MEVSFLESVVSTSVLNEQDSRRFGRSKLIPTAKPSSPSTSQMPHATPTFDPSTEFWPTPRAGTPGSRPNKKGGKVLEEEVRKYPVASPPLTSSPAASPASLSPSPGSDEAQTMTVSSGRKCTALLRKSGPVGSWLRMCLGSSSWRSTRCYLTWKPSATPSGRLLFRLAPSMPRTDESEALFWRPPTAEDCRDRAFARNSRGEPKLSAQVKMWPTPREFMHKDSATDRGKGNLGEKVGGQLNVDWVSILMGYPVDWTVVDGSAAFPVSSQDKRTVCNASKLSATPSSRNLRRKSPG